MKTWEKDTGEPWGGGRINGGWHVVMGKKNKRYGDGHRQRKVDIASRFMKDDDRRKDCTSFYFTNFPERLWARNLLEIFSKHGRVKEVVIPGRRNALGHRFGFVRFFDVRNPERMAIMLDNIFVEGEKIHVNLPRFQREDPKKLRPNPIPKAPSKATMVWKEKLNPNFIQQRDVTKDMWSYDIPDVGQLVRAMVGEVINPGDAYNIHEFFAREGVFTIKATPLGSNLVLLEGGQDDDDFTGFIDDAKEWLAQWFKWVRPWKPTDVDTERVTWIRCYGVPVHAWNADFFEKLSANVGVYMCSDDNTALKKSFDVARIMVRTPITGTVNKVIQVSINKVSFSIKMVEDWCGPSVWTKNDTKKVNDDSSSSDAEFLESYFSGNGDTFGDASGDDNDFNGESMPSNLRGSNGAIKDGINEKAVDEVQPLWESSNLNINGNHEAMMGGTQAGGATPTMVEESLFSSNQKSGPALVTCVPNDQHGVDAPPALTKTKKERKILMVAPKHNPRKGKLKKAPRELKSVSTASLEENDVDAVPSVSNQRPNSSSLFSAGVVLCDGSISSGNIACCNNKFWILQSKSVAQKVWESAKSLGIEGNMPDEHYVRLIEEGEARDEEACSKRVNTNGVP